MTSRNADRDEFVNCVIVLTVLSSDRRDGMTFSSYGPATWPYDVNLRTLTHIAGVGPLSPTRSHVSVRYICCARRRRVCRD